MKKFAPIIIYSIVLALFTTYVALDTFVIPKAEVNVENPEDDFSKGGNIIDLSGIFEDDESGENPDNTSVESPDNSEENSENTSSGSSDVSEEVSIETIITEDTYYDGYIYIKITEYVEYDTVIHVADIKLASPELLKTAFANDKYGRNIKEKTSEMAERKNAILAVNGDFYGSREKGFVLRNGKVYKTSSSSSRENLAMYGDGSFEIAREKDLSEEELLAKNAMQVFTFGPGLVENGEVTVSKNEEVGQAMASNPRTAIGIIDDLHYVLIVSDGRTDESEGLSLFELGTFMQSIGVKTGYNLDGGGSSTMWFNGKIVNYPTTNGSFKERSVSDIVYIGYEY
jgi:exopolysaccharide biosynthesis protein